VIAIRPIMSVTDPCKLKYPLLSLGLSTPNRIKGASEIQHACQTPLSPNWCSFTLSSVYYKIYSACYCRKFHAHFDFLNHSIG